MLEEDRDEKWTKIYFLDGAGNQIHMVREKISKLSQGETISIEFRTSIIEVVYAYDWSLDLYVNTGTDVQEQIQNGLYMNTSEQILLRVESDTMEAAGAASWSLSFKYTTDPNIEAQRQYIEKRDYVNAVVNVCNNTAFNLIDSVYEPKWLRAMIILRVHFHGR